MRMGHVMQHERGFRCQTSGLTLSTHLRGLLGVRGLELEEQQAINFQRF